MSYSSSSQQNDQVKLNQIGLSYSNGTEALKNLSLTLKAGEFVSLVGPSGCGKSTLLRVISGLIAPNSGMAEVCGLSPDEARQQKQISCVFQSHTLMPWRNVEDNIALPLELKKKSKESETTGSILSRIGLTNFAKAYPRELSGGMRMRAALGRALIIKPDLLLMDEPFGALDEITRTKLNEDLLSLWLKDKTTILFVTHNVYEAAFLSSRVLVMSARPGRITQEFQVPFAYPRTTTLRDCAEFGNLAGQIRQALEAGFT